MKCEQVRVLLDQLESDDNALEQSFAREHLLHCESCRAAVHAVHVLKAEATMLVPGPRAGAFERALLAATRAPAPAMPARSGFWSGMGLGAALAAGLVLALVFGLPREEPLRGGATPVISMLTNEVRDVRIALESPEPLVGAGIRVVWTGAIGLRGFEGQHELSWSTDLDRGANALTLPVVALGPGSGQLVVEVRAGGKRRTFVVDVQAAAASKEQA